MSAQKKNTLFHRQKVLLALLEKFGGKLPNLDFQKYLFLFTRICQQDKSYDFVPYKYGCFSFQSYADCRKLIDSGIIASVDSIWELKKTDSYLSQLKKDEQKKIELFHNRYKDIQGNSLIKEVYRDYPYFAIRSEIAKNIMSYDEMEKIEEAKPTQDEYCFFTIGYEGNSFENYLNRLIENNIKLLCDVRNVPMSRKYGFSKNTLADTLEKLGIQYMHIPELGIETEKRQNLHSPDDYEELFEDYEETTLKNNHQFVVKLLSLLQEHRRIAITCFEAEHKMCHRSRVSDALNTLPEWEYNIVHI